MDNKPRRLRTIWSVSDELWDRLKPILDEDDALNFTGCKRINTRAQSELQRSELGSEDGVGLSLSRQERVGDEESEEGEELFAEGVCCPLLVSDSTLLERRERFDEDDSLLEFDSSLR